jgi:hypothetical protein
VRTLDEGGHNIFRIRVLSSASLKPNEQKERTYKSPGETSTIYYIEEFENIRLTVLIVEVCLRREKRIAWQTKICKTSEKIELSTDN